MLKTVQCQQKHVNISLGADIKSFHYLNEHNLLTKSPFDNLIFKNEDIQIIYKLFETSFVNLFDKFDTQNDLIIDTENEIQYSTSLTIDKIKLNINDKWNYMLDQIDQAQYINFFSFRENEFHNIHNDYGLFLYVLQNKFFPDSKAKWNFINFISVQNSDTNPVWHQVNKTIISPQHRFIQYKYKHMIDLNNGNDCFVLNNSKCLNFLFKNIRQVIEQ